MAILKNLLVSGGASRFIGKSYFSDVDISGTASLASLSLSGNLAVYGTSTFTGNVTANGTLGVTGNLTTNANLYVLTGNIYLQNNRLAIKGISGDTWLRINDTKAFTSGVYFGSSDVRTDGALQVGANGTYFKSNSTNTTIANLVAPNATFSTATVTGDLKVNGVLHSNEFIKNVVKAVGGQLYISPTFQSTSNTTISCTAATTTSLSLTIRDSAITSDEYAGARWLKDSKIMFSGTLVANTDGHSEELVFSSIPGVVAANMNSTSGVLQVTLEYANASTYFKAASVSYSDVSVMMYVIHNGQDYPVGIYLKSYGSGDKLSYIDIYGGTSTSPHARLGNLGGITYGSSALANQWGLYTNNGYFTGQMNAEGGSIGATDASHKITIGSNSTNSYIYYGMDSRDNTSANGFYLGTDGIALGKGVFKVTDTGDLIATNAAITGVITATSGTIGGISANSSYGLYTNSKTTPTSAKNGFLISNQGAIYLGAYNSATGVCPFQVDENGVLNAVSVTLGNPNGYHSTMTSSAFVVYNGSNTSVASFGAVSIIGDKNSRGLQLDSSGMSFYYSGLKGFFIGSYMIGINYIYTTITQEADYITRNNIKYYKVIQINSSWDVYYVAGNITGTEKAVDDWVIQNNYLYVYDGYEDGTSFTDNIRCQYRTSGNNAFAPYMILGESGYDETNKAGYYSLASGVTCLATGNASIAVGNQSIAKGEYSVAMGNLVEAVGSSSISMGYNTKASGYWSTAMGSNTEASGQRSTAMGYNTKASGYCSTAMGSNTEASGQYSTAMGSDTKASGQSSTAMGDSTEASGYCSTAMGSNTEASEYLSTAMGYGTEASGQRSTAMGSDTKASGYCSTAMGYKTKASGYWSTAMGSNTEASEYYSTAMGYATKASGSYSTAMGYATKASQDYSTAMGYNTIAFGQSSTAMGENTVTSADYSTVIGRYNKATITGNGTEENPYQYSDIGNYAFIIGNGYANQRSNALEIDWYGNVMSYGSLYSENDDITATEIENYVFG